MTVAGPDLLRFSPEEMRRRTDALDTALAEAGARHCVVYGANRTGSGVQWLTGWPVTREAVVVHTPGLPDVLLVNFYNHVPQASALAIDADVRWAGASTADSVVTELEHRGAASGGVAVVGAVPFGVHGRLTDAFGPVAELGPSYIRLRMRKSGEELARLREAARLTDASCAALRDGTRAGSTDHELGALVEASYRSVGGANHIHYFSLTSMAEPQAAVPAQWPSGRVVARGDVLACELSASVAVDYPGQLLRSFTVAAEPTPLVRELHEIADEALSRIEQVLAPGVLPEQIVSAAEVIEDAGFTTIDDLVHGLGGGYLPPVFGSRSRTLSPLPATPFEEGMTVVVQPNVTTPDRTLGVQTGEMFEITSTGCRSLHDFPRGLGRITG
ncbi:MAG: M24 family metallopeptidase [Nocardioides sp.]